MNCGGVKPEYATRTDSLWPTTAALQRQCSVLRHYTMTEAIVHWGTMEAGQSARTVLPHGRYRQLWGISFRSAAALSAISRQPRCNASTFSLESSFWAVAVLPDANSALPSARRASNSWGSNFAFLASAMIQSSALAASTRSSRCAEAAFTWALKIAASSSRA